MWKYQKIFKRQIIINFFDHIFSVVIHKMWVFIFIARICARLLWRAIIHDYSKFSPAEVVGFVMNTHKLKGLTYGSEGYKESLRKLEPSLNHHYKVNSHHPEYYGLKGISGMDLLDIVEMICDWTAAVKRHRDGNIRRSIDVNKKRYKVPEQLNEIFLNSVRM